MSSITFPLKESSMPYFMLELNELSFEVLITTCSDLSVVKEDLYHQLYKTKKEFDAFVAQRPDFSYALEPLQPGGDESAFVHNMMTNAQSLSLGPRFGCSGAFADLARKILRTYSDNVIVRCDRSLAIDCQQERLLPIFPHFVADNDFCLTLPPKALGIAWSENAVVMGSSALIAALAVHGCETELTNGASLSEAADLLKPLVPIGGGVLRRQQQLYAWGSCRSLTKS